MDCINLGRCNLYFCACANGARYLRSVRHDCASSPAEPLQLRSCNSRKRYIKEIPGNLNYVMYCIPLHQINSHRFFDVCNVLCPNGIFQNPRWFTNGCLDSGHMASGIASQAAWYRMENGPKRENRKKLAEQKKMAHGQKWEKNGPRMPKKWKNDLKSHFSTIFGPFFSISGRGPFSIYRPIFSYFCVSARFPFNARRPDSQKW